MKKIKVVVLAAGLSVATIACGGDEEPSGGTNNTPPATQGGGPVVIQATDELKFDPATVTIAAGTTVTWRNIGNLPHTVTFPNHNKSLEEKGTLTFTFTSAGTVNYTCTIHPGMKGTIVVQ